MSPVLSERNLEIHNVTDLSPHSTTAQPHSSTSPQEPDSSPRPKMPPKQSSRLPPPALFQGPPSRNESNMSVSMLPNSGHSLAPNTLNTPAATTKTSPKTTTTTTTTTKPHSPRPNLSHHPAAANMRRDQAAATQTANEVKNENDRAEALWAEMQNTLAEVELSAANGIHVFGGTHSRALEELREAQLALARAWSASEYEGVDGAAGDDEDGDGDGGFSAGVVRGVAGAGNAGSGKRW